MQILLWQGLKNKMIVFIHHSVNPYRTALFNELAKKTKIAFKVYFLSEPAKNRKWKPEDFNFNFPYKFLDGFKVYFPGNDHWYFQFNSGLWKNLKKDKPSLIICFGWNFFASYLAFVYSKMNKIKYGIWSGSTKYEPSIFRTITLPVIKILVRYSDLLIAYGSRARDYLLSIGVPDKNISIAFNTVDTDKLIKMSKYYESDNYVRDKYKISKNKKIVLFVGQYIKRKGIYPLLKVADSLKRNESVLFLLVGYGQEEGKVKEYIRDHNLKNVILPGFVKNTEMAKYYTASDLFILPSFEEVWGLVVNEAMCAGKAVLVSKYAGCSEDLVKDNYNGYIINPDHHQDIRNKIILLLEDDKKRVEFGNRCLSIIKKFNLDQNIKTISKTASLF